MAMAGQHPSNVPPLILKRGDPSRRHQDDYDVLEKGVVVARTSGGGRAGGPPLDVGERPQRRDTPMAERRGAISAEPGRNYRFTGQLDVLGFDALTVVIKHEEPHSR